jgi:pimeloyl-ACP methyl ester carboxylesterase
VPGAETAPPDVEAAASGRRAAIIFLHGTRLTGAQWAVQAAALDDEFLCFTPDLPGHGSAADIPFTLAGAAETVAEMIDAKGGGRAIVVGLSLGGYVAMEVAARWPERVAGLVLAGSSAEPTGPRSLAYDGLAWILDTVDPGVQTRLNEWFFRWRYPPAIADPIIAGGFHFAGGSVAVRSLVGELFRPRLARFPGRTLILNGEFDLLFRLSQRSFVAAAADARSVIVRRAVHLSNLDRPDAFTAAVRRFARATVASVE